MAGYALILDAVSEDASNAQLDINDGTTYRALSPLEFPTPDEDPQWASSADTEGAMLASNRHQNRTITIPLRVYGGTAAGLSTALKNLQQKMSKVFREGGTLKVTDPNAKVVVFDLLTAAPDIAITQRNASGNSTDVSLRFTAKPYGRLTAQVFSSHSETTLPVLIFTETGVQGDVPALGRLTITEAQAQDQWLLLWGAQSQFYDSAATAALFYEAEGRTPLGAGAATNAGPTGASGSSTMYANAVRTAWQAVMSTQASGGGAHLTHVGTYQVWARMSPGVSEPFVALEWSVGDFRVKTTNDPVQVTFMGNGVESWKLVNLGQVTIPKAVNGAQRWEGRIIARTDSTSPSGLYIDYLLFVPVEGGYGEVRAAPPVATATSLSALDAFNSTGTLHGKTAPVGGAWSTSLAGAAGDLTVGTDHTATATAATFGYATVPASLGACVVEADISISNSTAGGSEVGVVARYAGTNTQVAAFVRAGPSGTPPYSLVISGRVSSSGVMSGSVALPAFQYGAMYTIRLAIDAAGRYFVWLGPAGVGLGDPVMAGVSSTLASAGSLASGTTGLYFSISGSASVTFDNFSSWVPTNDAAMYASRQLQVRNDGAIRQDSAGTVWTRPSSYEGDYLLVAPAGQENRRTRMIVKASRNLEAAADTAIDDISAQLTVIPRVLVVGE